MSIATRIKEARENLGLSRNQLATLINVTPSAVSNYENGISSPKEPVLFALFSALKCDANYLFQDDIKSLNIENSNKNSPTNPIEDKQKEVLLKNYDEMNEEGRKKLVDYAEDLATLGKYKKRDEHDTAKEVC